VLSTLHQLWLQLWRLLLLQWLWLWLWLCL